LNEGISKEMYFVSHGSKNNPGIISTSSEGNIVHLKKVNDRNPEIMAIINHPITITGLSIFIYFTLTMQRISAAGF